MTMEVGLDLLREPEEEREEEELNESTKVMVGSLALLETTTVPPV